MTAPGEPRFVLAGGGLAEVVPSADLAGLADALRAAGVVVAQCLLDPGQTAAVEPLHRAGFRHVTRLVTLRRPAAAVVRRESVLTVEPGERVRNWSEVFAATLAGSLDLPELAGVRPPAVEFAGYPTGPRFVARLEGRAVGVLLLAPAEVLYLGLAPADAWAADSVTSCWPTPWASWPAARAVTVGADGRNRPALRLYDRHGFRPCRSQEVFLWTAGGLAPSSHQVGWVRLARLAPPRA